MKKLYFLFGIIILAQLNTVAQTKRVLIEEATGTWCTWCPRGIVFGDKMVQDYDALFVAIHVNDPMANTPEYQAAINIPGLPGGNVDRTMLNVDPLGWEGDVITQLNTTPPADISVETSFNPATRNLTMTITADFFTALNGDFRLGAVVVEDGVTGTTTDYDQSNAYSGGSVAMGGWENLPDPVPAAQMVYDHVARNLTSDYEGDAGSLPGSISAGSQHSHTLSWTLPADHDEEYVHVIGYITNAATGKILNAGKSAYLLGNTNAQPMFVSEGKTSGLVGSDYLYEILAHDPDDLNLTITGVDIPSWMTLTTTGLTTASLSGNPTDEGSYPVILEVSDGNTSRLQSFQVNILNSGGIDWHLVGNEGFTSGSASSVALEINELGIPYVMSVNSNDLVSVHTFENGAWSVLGNTFSGDEFLASMALDTNGIPYVFTNNNGLKVYKFDGTNWQQLGGVIGDGVHSDITIANDGTPYISYMDITTNSRGICKKWDGTDWITVGGEHFTTDLPAVWTKITTNNGNQPVVLYGSGTGNGPFYSNVIEFNGTDWEIIGGGDIDSTNSTYFSHSIAIDSNDKIYVAFTAESGVQKLNVYEWEGSNWIMIGDNISGGSTYDTSMALDLQENPVIGFRDEAEGGKTTVMSFDGVNWATLGLSGFTDIASDQSLAYSPDGEPYIAYKDETNNEKATVKRYGAGILNINDHIVATNNTVVYPNPNQGNFVVLTSIKGQFQLIDYQGRIISEKVIEPSNTEKDGYAYQFDYQNLTPGLYFLRIINEQKAEVVKILIE